MKTIQLMLRILLTPIMAIFSISIVLAVSILFIPIIILRAAGMKESEDTMNTMDAIAFMCHIAVGWIPNWIIKGELRD